MGEGRRRFFDAENYSYIEGKKGGRDQGSGVCIRGSLDRDGVPGNTIAWGQRQGVVLKKDLRSFNVFATTFHYIRDRR